MFDSKDNLITELHSQLIEKEQKINTQALEIAKLNKVLGKIKELVKNYEELEKILGAGKPRFQLYKLQEILKSLGDKENED